MSQFSVIRRFTGLHFYGGFFTRKRAAWTNKEGENFFPLYSVNLIFYCFLTVNSVCCENSKKLKFVSKYTQKRDKGNK